MYDAKRRHVYVGAARVGFIEPAHDGTWKAHSFITDRTATLTGDIHAECWVREELYSLPGRPNPYEPETHSEG